MSLITPSPGSSIVGECTGFDFDRACGFDYYGGCCLQTMVTNVVQTEAEMVLWNRLVWKQRMGHDVVVGDAYNSCETYGSAYYVRNKPGGVN